MNKLILILLLAVCAQADAGNCEYPEPVTARAVASAHLTTKDGKNL